ncbi:MAG: UBP-type zinc finger domain-containing protein [Candidatus Nitrosocosmicus sp.]
MAQKCEHFDSLKQDGISPRTSGCEECEKEGRKWVEIRMCLTCGHVGCCDSSPGLHARKHFEHTTHPVMMELPTKSWKWCYIHDQYN